MNTCDRHNEVVKTLDDHEVRIQTLEKTDVETAQKIQNLIEKLDNLMSWMKTFMGWMKALILLGASSLIGFFFWYIQSLKG